MGCARSTVTRFNSSWRSRNRAFCIPLAMGDLFGAVAREVVEAYGDQIMSNPVGTGPFRLAEWRRSSRIVLERNPTYRERFYDAEPMRTTPKARRCWQRFSGRKLPMIDRVEISIIEEQQPRWLSFLNQAAGLDGAHRQRVHQHCRSQRQTGAEPAAAEHAALSRARFGSDDERLQHGRSGHRRLHARQGRAASCDQSGDQYAAGDSSCTKKSGDSCAVAGDAEHGRLRSGISQRKRRIRSCRGRRRCSTCTVTSIATATAGAINPTVSR